MRSVGTHQQVCSCPLTHAGSDECKLRQYSWYFSMFRTQVQKPVSDLTAVFSASNDTGPLLLFYCKYEVK